MFKLALVAITMAYFVVPAQAASLPPVNTNIVNANKAAFVGSMITAQTNPTATEVIRQAVTPLTVEFRNIEACQAWLANLAGATPGVSATFIGNGNGAGKNLDADWAKFGYIGYIGGCVDTTDGSVTLAQ
jgi:hypothetical protein